MNGNRTAKPALGNKGLADKLYHRTKRKAATRKSGSSIALAFHVCGKASQYLFNFLEVLKKLQADKQYSKRETVPVECMEPTLQGMN